MKRSHPAHHPPRGHHARTPRPKAEMLNGPVMVNESQDGTCQNGKGGKKLTALNSGTGAGATFSETQESPPRSDVSNRDTPGASPPPPEALVIGMDMASDGGDRTAVAFVGAAGVEFVLTRTTDPVALRQFLDTVTAKQHGTLEVVIPTTAKERRRVRRLVNRLKEVGYAARA